MNFFQNDHVFFLSPECFSSSAGGRWVVVITYAKVLAAAFAAVERADIEEDEARVAIFVLITLTYGTRSLELRIIMCT